MALRLISRHLSGCVAASVVLALGAWVTGCGTDPVNPDGCRAIEEARCEAVAACPGYGGFDVDACKRFYRDQCLHGLSTESDPGEPRIDQCVLAVELAGGCAKAGATTCPALPFPASQAAAPCTVIEHPEQFDECSFLAPPAANVPDAAVEATSQTSPDAEAGAEAPLDDAG